MKKIGVLILFSLLIINRSFGQWPDPSGVNLPSPHIKTTEEIEASNNAKLYKDKVKNVSKLMKSDDDIIQNYILIKSHLVDIQNLYYSSINKYPSFIGKVRKSSTQFDELKLKFSDYTNKTYYPAYEDEKARFNLNIAANNITDAKINLNNLYDIKSKLCWIKNENNKISVEVDDYASAIKSYEQFYSTLDLIKDQISKDYYVLQSKNFNELTSLMNQWYSITKLNTTTMQNQIIETKCDFNKLLFKKLNIVADEIVSLPLNNSELSSKIENFTSLYDVSYNTFCIDSLNFSKIKEKVLIKSELLEQEKIKEQVKIEKEEKLALEKIKTEEPVEINDVIRAENYIGVPEVIIVLENKTDEEIIALDVDLYFYDAMGRAVNNLYENTNKSRYVLPCQLLPYDSFGVTATIYENYNHRYVVPKIIRVKYESGKIVTLKKPITYNPPKDE